VAVQVVDFSLHSGPGRLVLDPLPVSLVGHGVPLVAAVFVQATHVWGTALVVLAAAVIPSAMVLSLASVLGTPVAEQPILNVVVSIPLVLYVAASLRHVHGGDHWTAWIGAGLRAAATFWVIRELLLAYRALLFVVGFYTT